MADGTPLHLDDLSPEERAWFHGDDAERGYELTGRTDTPQDTPPPPPPGRAGASTPPPADEVSPSA